MNELSHGPAKEAFLRIHAKYTALKNKECQRKSEGYYFYGGTFEVVPEILDKEFVNSKKIKFTMSQPDESARKFRFSLKKTRCVLENNGFG